MINAADLRTMQADPGAYLRAVLIETDAGPRPWAAVADGWQVADVEAILPALRRLVSDDAAGEGVLRRAWWERGRGHAKTSDFALLLLWVAMFSRRRRRGVWAAADQDQGLLGLQAVKLLAQHNPWIEELLDIRTDSILNRHTGTTIDFITSDAATSWGETPDVVVADELVYWRKRDLFDSLFSSAGKRRDCVFLVGTNAGWKTSWTWELRQRIAKDAAWYFSALPDCVASWIDAGRLAEQERILPPLVFLRAWRNRWTDGEGDALEAGDIDRAVRLPGPATGPEPGMVYLGGLDLSVSRDASALVILGKSVGWTERRVARHVGILEDLGYLDQPEDESESEYHPGDGRLRLARCVVWRPRGGPRGGRISIDAIKEAVVDAHRTFGLALLAADVYQAQLLIEQTRKAGVPSEGVYSTPTVLQEQASAVPDGFRESEVELYNYRDLLADLKALRVREYSNGRAFRLESPKKSSDEGGGTRHGDAASAFALAVWAARRAGPAYATQDRRLVLSA